MKKEDAPAQCGLCEHFIASETFDGEDLNYHCDEGCILSEEKCDSFEPLSDGMADYDHCYECSGLGDDYYVGDDGEMHSACNECPYKATWCE